jgi:hypothetical protein
MKRASASTSASMFWGLLFAVTAGCDGCGEPPSVGELAELRGVVELDEAAEPIDWAFASPEERVHVGDAIRTGASAEAMLRLTGGGRLFVRERSVVRFSPGARAGSDYRVGVELGEADVEAVSDAITFDSIFGETRIERGARVRLTGGARGGARFEVVVGSATVERAGGQSTRYAQGQSFFVDVGGAIVEERAPAAPVAPAQPAAPAAPAVPEAPVAEVIEPGVFVASIDGEGVTARAPGARAFSAVAAGSTRFEDGTRVAVGAGSRVELRSATGTALVRGSAEFTVGGAGGALVSAANGTLVVTTNGETRVIVPGGAIVVRGGASELAVSNEGTSLSVASGSASVEARGASTVLAAGDTTTLSREGRVTEAERAPTAAGFSIEAGESATVHDPRAPTAVRVRFGSQCPGEGVVEVARGGSFARAFASRGTGGANVLMPIGAQRYRVRCVGPSGIEAEPKAAGTLRIVRDAGTQALARRAPKTTVETDGRRYTVLYQTMLPEITVAWPRPPEASGYVLTVTNSAGRAQTVRSASPSTVFSSGRLEEGSYSLVWAAEGAPARSRPTSVVISFDDDTPVAYLRSPAANAPLTAPIHIDGVAQTGASASVNGQALAMDARARFQGDVAAPSEGQCLAVRVAHPERGVHYYLRCGNGS